MMDDVRLSMVSMNSVLGDTEGNLSRMLALCDAASSVGSDIVCFPELCLSGYSMPGSTELVTTIDSPEVGAVVDKSSETGMCICFGFVDEGPRIAQAVVECGKVLGAYHKTHLGEREAPVMVPGDSLDAIRTSKAVLGIQVCWEAHFPEMSCTYALKGADILLMPFASGLGGERRRSSWDRILPARAYDNTVYVGACNGFGPTGSGTTLGGGAAIYDARGNKLAEDFSGECMVTADLDPEPLETIRAEGYVSMKDVYFLDKRRPDIYFR